jgi:hypothetical protein
MIAVVLLAASIAAAAAAAAQPLSASEARAYLRVCDGAASCASDAALRASIPPQSNASTDAAASVIVWRAAMDRAALQEAADDSGATLDSLHAVIAPHDSLTIALWGLTWAQRARVANRSDDAFAMPLEWKLSPEVRSMMASAPAAPAALHVGLNPGAVASLSASVTLADKWQTVVNTSATMSSASRSLIAASNVAAAAFGTVVQTLRDQVEAMWVEPVPRYNVTNRYAAAVTQSGGAARSLNNIGLTGRGEVVGVADSGLDAS